MIHTLTLNPAIDKIFFLETVEKGITNRIVKQTETVGGKGTHVSMNLSQMGIENNAFGLVSGNAGSYIVQTLAAWGVTPRFRDLHNGESRTNYILLESDKTCTTIAEKGPRLTEDDLQALIQQMEQEVETGDFLVLSGDASNCPDAFVYNRIAAALASNQPRIFLDTSGEALRKGLECTPFLIKPNQDELEALCGFSIDSEADVLRGIDSLAPYGIEVVAVSLGERGSIVRFGNEYYRALAPSVEVQSTAGCGDSFLAALLYGYQEQLSSIEMLRFATAVSAATASSPLSVGYDKAYADALLDRCEVTQIK